MNSEIGLTHLYETSLPNTESRDQQDNLDSPRHSSQNNTDYVDGHQFSLRQADGGKDAWLFLAAGFMAEFLIWGFPSCFGVFRDYLTTHEPFASKPTGISAIGTTATGLMYLLPIALFPAFRKWPRLKLLSPYIGLPLVSISIAAASFASKVSHLIVTQGILYGIGGAIAYYPTLIFLDEWFIQRKGLAYGIMWSGAGAGGLVMPFIFSALLDRYGLKTTLRAWAIATFTLSTPLVYFIRPRVPLSRAHRPTRLDFSFLKTSTFWLLQTGNAVECLGFFIPQIYLPSYARSISLTQSNGTLAVSLLNLTSVISLVAIGMLVDRFHVTTVMFISTLGSTMVIFLVWGFTTNLPVLIVFASLYGLLAGGFTSTYSGILMEVQKVSRGADSGMLIAVLSAGRGTGAIASGPLSEALLKAGPLVGKGAAAYGTTYGGLIVFTGMTSVVGGVSFLGKRLGWM